jgi:hypothetical protein
VKRNLTIFVCSTFADLAEEREAVLDAVRKLQLQHDSMEFFGARPGMPIKTCLAEVRASDILVVIVGHRYGSLVPGLGVSFSEAEYEEGFRLRKPCLVYTLDENVPVLPKNIERDPDKFRQLDRWRSLLRERHTIAHFTDSHDLAVRVAADLARTMQALEDSEQARPEALSELQAELNRTREELEGAREELSEFRCPYCGAGLAERISAPADPEEKYWDAREIFDCGYVAFGGSVERPCPEDPQFPAFEDFELDFSSEPTESHWKWACFALGKTRMARKLSLGRALGGTKEEAVQKLREQYDRCARRKA